MRRMQVEAIKGLKEIKRIKRIGIQGIDVLGSAVGAELNYAGLRQGRIRYLLDENHSLDTVMQHIVPEVT